MPIKVATAMQWAATNLAFDDFYASSDDDFVVDFVSIADFLEYQVKLRKYKEEKIGLLRTNKETRISMPIYCVYYLDKIKGPNRDKSSKWYINETEYSLDRYPPYCGGGFYMMPVAMAYDLYKMSKVTRVLAMDDVWVTGILRQKLGRGDDNVVKAEWPPTNLRDSDETKKLWKHLWGDYGMIKKDVAKLLPEAWDDWNKRLKGRPHCMAKEQTELGFVHRSETETDNAGEPKPIMQKQKSKNSKETQKKPAVKT